MRPTPVPFTLPEDWTPEQAWAVHELLDDLLEHIAAHYGIAVQHWLGSEDTEEADRERQPDLFEVDFDDPLSF